MAFLSPCKEGEMRKSKYSEHQIIHAIKQSESGLPVKEICRALGVSVATLLSMAFKIQWHGSIRFHTTHSPMQKYINYITQVMAV